MESPFGSFYFESPADPPSGPALITPMAFLYGPYNDPYYLPAGSTTFMTMDASGKVKSVSEVPGFADKKEGTQVTRYLFVRTVNGIPILTANAAAGGMYDDGVEESPTTGTGKALIPLGPASPPQGGVQQVTVMSSFSGKRDKTTDKDPLQVETLDLDVNQLGGIIVKDWSMYLDIYETVSPRGVHYFVADLYFYNPNGTRTYFAPKTVKYSATTGYSITFASGKLYDQFDVPINDAHGKQLVDKNSSIKFTNLLFKKLFDANDIPYWEPAAGAVNYKFLGQNGFGHVFNFEITLY